MEEGGGVVPIGAEDVAVRTVNPIVRSVLDITVTAIKRKNLLRAVGNYGSIIA